MSHLTPASRAININVNRRTLIRTTVARDVSDVDCVVNEFLSKGESVIGMDTEWTLIDIGSGRKQRKQLAILQLCNGDCCLIMQLCYFEVIPKSLFNFLHLPEFTFVGIGIKENIVELERVYGVGCKNAVELGPLAAVDRISMQYKIEGQEKVMYDTLHQLGIGKWKSLVFGDWGDYELNEKRVYCVEVNVLAYHKIGINLVGSRFLTGPIYKYD